MSGHPDRRVELVTRRTPSTAVHLEYVRFDVKSAVKPNRSQT